MKNAQPTALIEGFNTLAAVLPLVAATLKNQKNVLLIKEEKNHFWKTKRFTILQILVTIKKSEKKRTLALVLLGFDFCVFFLTFFLRMKEMVGFSFCFELHPLGKRDKQSK